MNILNNNTFRIIVAGLLGVIGTLVVQGLTDTNEVLISDTTVETVNTTTTGGDIVNTIDNINDVGTSGLTTETSGLNVELDATTNSTTTAENIDNNQ
jgi:hypothetical protein